MIKYNEPTEPLTQQLIPPQKGPGKLPRLLVAGSLVFVVVLTVALGMTFIFGMHTGKPASMSEELGKGPWHTAGAQLLDAHNQPLRIAAVNWSGFETSTFVVHGLHDRTDKSISERV